MVRDSIEKVIQINLNKLLEVICVAQGRIGSLICQLGPGAHCEATKQMLR